MEKESPETHRIAELQARAAHGEQAATDELCASFQGMLINACHALSPHAKDEDLLAEAEIAFLDAIASYDARREVPFPAYAKRKVWGSLATYLRRERKYLGREVRQIEAEGDWIADNVPDERNGIRDAGMRLDLAAALRRLSPRERRLLRLSVWEGCTLREAAAELGITHQWASQLRRGALAKLRAMLAG